MVRQGSERRKRTAASGGDCFPRMVTILDVQEVDAARISFGTYHALAMLSHGRRWSVAGV